jgi:hypothetical protein
MLLLIATALIWLRLCLYALFCEEQPPNPVAECGDYPGNRITPLTHCFSSWDKSIHAVVQSVRRLRMQIRPPPQMTELGEAAACSLHFDDLASRDPVGVRYMMKTHWGYGACGVCWSTQPTSKCCYGHWRTKDMCPRNTWLQCGCCLLRASVGIQWLQSPQLMPWEGHLGTF